MKLVFDIIKSGRQSPDKSNYHFNKVGGTIGRSSDASWSLNDKENHISNLHVYIFYEDGLYFIQDESTNGTFLKFPYKRLAKNVKLEISPNDIYILADHEIQARLVEDSFVEDINNDSNEHVDNLFKSFDNADARDFEEADIVSQFSQTIPDDDFLQNDEFTSLENGNLNIEEFIEPNNSKAREESPIASAQSHERHIQLPHAQEQFVPREIDSKSLELEQSFRVLEQCLDIEINSLDSFERDKLMGEIGAIVTNSLDGLKHSLYLQNKIKEDLNVYKVEEDITKINPIILGKNASKLLEDKNSGDTLGMSKISDAIKKSFIEIDNHSVVMHTSAKNIMKITVNKFSPKNLEFLFSSEGKLWSFINSRREMMWKEYTKRFAHLNDEPADGFKMIEKNFTEEYKNIEYSIKLSNKKNISGEI